MDYKKKPPLTAREIRILVLLGIITFIVIGTLVGANIQLGRSVSGGGSFFAVWGGARAFLLEGTGPYSGTAIGIAQQQTYGRPAREGENPYILTIPFFILPVFFPIALIPDAATARGIWLFLNEVFLLGAVFLCLQLIEWQPRRVFRIVYPLLSIFSFYSVTALLDGTPVILLGLLYFGILFAYTVQQDEVAGALLVFAMFAWEVGGLFLLLMLWKAIYDKRWRMLAGFGMTFFVLLVLSLLIYPGWLLPFLTAALANMRAHYGITTLAILTQLSPKYGEHAAQALTVLLVIMLIYEWAAARQADSRRLLWAACLTLAVTPLTGFRTEMSNLVVLSPGLALILAATTDRWRTGYWLSSLLMLLVFLLPWSFLVHWFSLQDRRFYDYLFLFYPVFIIIGLYWTRWWFIRPPRTWFDYARATLNSQPRGKSLSK